MANLKPTGCHFIVPVAVYGKEVLFAFGYPRKRIIRLLKSNPDPLCKEILGHFRDYKGSYLGLCITGSRGQTFITMPEIPATSKQFATLAHEIFHAVENIMSDVGNHHPENEVSESWAYLVSYLTEEVYEKLTPYY